MENDWKMGGNYNHRNDAKVEPLDGVGSESTHVHVTKGSNVKKK